MYGGTDPKKRPRRDITPLHNKELRISAERPAGKHGIRPKTRVTRYLGSTKILKIVFETHSHSRVIPSISTFFISRVLMISFENTSLPYIATENGKTSAVIIRMHTIQPPKRPMKTQKWALRLRNNRDILGAI
jgi:hypothetical protein